MKTYGQGTAWTWLKSQLNSWKYIINTILPALLGLISQYINMGKCPVHSDPVHEVLKNRPFCPCLNNFRMLAKHLSITTLIKSVFSHNRLNRWFVAEKGNQTAVTHSIQSLEARGVNAMNPFEAAIIVALRETHRAIQESYKEFAQYSSTMTAYEKSVIERSIKACVEENYPAIANGIFGEWKQSIEGVKTAQAAVAQDKGREINRIDSVKLPAELQVAKALVGSVSTTNSAWGGPAPADRLAAIYQESLASGDVYKQCAVVEVLQNAPNRFSSGGRMVVNQVKVQAEVDLAEMHIIDEIRQAEAKGNLELVRCEWWLLGRLFTACAEATGTEPSDGVPLQEWAKQFDTRVSTEK